MSLFGYSESVRSGADALEISLARSSDGVWFGLHDATLDRTSGTSHFVAADHTWAEISQYRISAAATTDPTQPARPYMRLEELLDAFAGKHVIFVDPKFVPGSFYPELMTILTSAKVNVSQSYIAKSIYQGAPWAKFAHAHGLTTWGFYYDTDIAANPDVVESTEKSWDVLGLNYTASKANWAQIRSFRKPVIAHIVPTRVAARTANAKGASGLMISGIREVLG
jgi:glycerophosphoryl diester phosphodiesterase